MNYNSLIILVSILCILAMSYLILKKQKFTKLQSVEKFYSEDALQCSYRVPEDADSNFTHSKCLNDCMTWAHGQSDDNIQLNCIGPDSSVLSNGSTGCNDVCSRNIRSGCTLPGKDNLTQCIINHSVNINGDTIDRCIKNCTNSTCDGCKSFRIRNPVTNNIVYGDYTNNIVDYEEKCTSNAFDQQFCSPCVEACLGCQDPTRCTWLESEDTLQASRENFQHTEFSIGVLPQNRSALIVWNEHSDQTSKYVIFIYKKTDKNTINVNNEQQQQTPLMIRTINKDFTTLGSNTHRITGLTNGVTYSVSVNKISKHSPPEVKASNTIDIVPSVVDVVNFSRLAEDNSIKNKELRSVGLLNSIKGKTFNITL